MKCQAAFFGTRMPQGIRASSPAARRGQALVVRSDSALIVNTKGGGHAFLGLHLAKRLLAAGHTVTILNDGDKDKLLKKAPYSQYEGQLEAAGATVLWGSPTAPATALPAGARFDIVYDNNGKDMDACKPLIDHFKGQVKHYVFVGSAGAYADDAVQPERKEGETPRKAKAGHTAVEAYLAAEGLPYTVFQPLYMYGPHTNKDCEQFFMDRVLRDRPVPIPGPGIQLTSLSNVEDVVAMMALVPGNPAAIGQHFNACSDRCISLDGIVKAVARAAGKEAQIVHYDPSAVQLAKGEGFPFRTEHFFASVDKAKRVLGWKPQHDFLGDVEQLVADYVASGRLDRDIDFSVDDKILASV